MSQRLGCLALITGLATAAFGGCTGELSSTDVMRAGLRVPAGPQTVRELGIAAWDLGLRPSGVTITSTGPDGSSRGSASYSMKTEGRRLGPVLVVEGRLATRATLRLSRRGLDDASLSRQPGASAWASALARDVAASSDAMEKYGPAPACAALVRTGAHACARTVVVCGGASRDCVTAARACAREALAADRCQRRSL